MRRYLAFNPQQYGDLYMATVAARRLKAADPEAHITFAIAADFRECAPLFIDHPHIDRIHILNRPRDGFDETDWRWIEEQKFHHVFNPMQDHDHSRPWWQFRHQAIEAAFMHGLPIPADETGKITLTRWFKPTSGFERYVAFAPWPAFHEGVRNPKAIQPERAQEIANWIKSQGYSVLQIGASNEPALEGAAKVPTDYFTSVRNILGCRCMVMGDSGLNWALSGYDFPVVGLYAHRYYGPEFVKNIQPINPNGRYLSAPTVGEIPMDQITAAISHFLHHS